MNEYHRSIMTEELLDFLNIRDGGLYLDGTLGDGGHTLAILEKGGRVVALDQDTDAIKRTTERLNGTSYQAGKDYFIYQSNFAKLRDVLTKNGHDQLDGALFDLGASTHQLLSPERGFSFQSDSPLDMRMDQSLGVTASDLLIVMSERELADLFAELGGESHAARIAKKIKQNLPKTTGQLADLIAGIKPRTGKLHPATKVFQALRMAVNLERDSLTRALPQVVSLLKKDATLAILSFHEGEDRIVKQFFKKQQEEKVLEILTLKPMVPTSTEINNNPRARSTKLRAAKKI